MMKNLSYWLKRKKVDTIILTTLLFVLSGCAVTSVRYEESLLDDILTVAGIADHAVIHCSGEQQEILRSHLEEINTHVAKSLYYAQMRIKNKNLVNSLKNLRKISERFENYLIVTDNNVRETTCEIQMRMISLGARKVALDYANIRGK